MTRQPVPIALPRAPVLDWASFRSDKSHATDLVATSSVQDLRSVAYTTSGRAAIYQALLQLALPKGSKVLVPTYHCPTMVAPVLLAGLQPVYFGLQADGLPDLNELDRRGDIGASAIIVAHYFGLPRSLAAVRQWCDGRSIALIEDCAHCHFGHAGERPVGAWGDYATASLSKFLPVPEAGLLGSAHFAISPMALRPPGAKLQIKGCIDVLEFAARHRRLAGLRPLLSVAFNLKNRRSTGISKVSEANARNVAASNSSSELPAEMVTMRHCDMERTENAPVWAAMVLNKWLPRQRTLTRRRDNYAQYRQAFTNVEGARPLFQDTTLDAAPYVFPLWVDDAERVYRAIVALELPVFRWDHLWPGTPLLEGDTGSMWSRHVLQLLCHQDLRPEDITSTSRAILRVLQQADSAPLGVMPSRHARRDASARATA